jgi:DegV family protein with EDD domain
VALTPYRCALITDSCCDLPRETVERHVAFYQSMRAGGLPNTAQVPMATYLGAFRSAAESAMPAVFLSFSSALSGTYDTSLIARDTVLAEFPDAEIHIVDTHAASTAQALLVLEAGRLHDQGATAAEIAVWAEANKHCVNGYFTLETLEHLRRGGRISDVAAAAGAMLDVRAVLKLDCDGALVIERVARGRKKSLRALADVFAKRAHAPAEKTVVIAHADSESDAHALEALLRSTVEIGEVVHIDVGPVIGAHTGPGMVACVFWGTEREG